MTRLKIRELALCGLFTALSAILSQIVIPLWPVPVTLTHISVYMSAGLLGAKRGAVSQAVYVALGAVGAPVFAGFTGGFGKVLGPTGGFMLGYIFSAFAAGYLIGKFGKSIWVSIPAMICSHLILTYIPGVLWFMYVMKSGVGAALAACVIPFMFGDLLKILLCSFLIKRLKA